MIKAYPSLNKPALLTVVTLTKNSEQFISRCIESYLDALKQVDTHLIKHVVADTNSQDKTIDTVKRVSPSSKIIMNTPKGLYASMYHDLIAGKKIELQDIFGYISKEGYENNVPTPVSDFIYAFLKPYINGR